MPGRKRGDFVEHDRAALRHFQAPWLARDGSRERAALMAEELRFHKLGGKAGAIDFQERRIAARAAFVNPARELVLARAAFAGDQNRGGGVGELLCDFKNVLRGWIGGDPHDIGRGSSRRCTAAGFIVKFGGPGWRWEIDALGGAPEPFEIVIVPRAFAEDVHDEIAVIEKHPFGAGFAFAMRQSALLG